MNLSIIWNYKALLDEGIRLIEELSSSNWTDYNVHDPGITTLEFLCYALTDLAGRVGLPLESHLAEKVGERIRLRTDFFEAHEILPCGAVTINDYRKILIDIPGIRNAWLHVVEGMHPPIHAIVEEDRLSFGGDADAQLFVRGFYNVDIEFDKTVVEQKKDQLKKEVRRTLMANRNLCEDFNEIEEIGLEEVTVCIDVELALDSNVDEVKAEMLYAIDEFIAPSLRRYTLQEMLDKDHRIDEILNGPVPQHGFVEDKDLGLSHNRGELHGSDLIQILMDISQIVAVRRMLFTTYRDGKVEILDEPAVVPLAEDRAIRFSQEKSKFRFFKEEIPYITNPTGVEQYLAEVRTRYQQAPIEVDDLRPELPKPEYVELGNYASIQHHYPKNYMVGHEGILPLASTGRRAAVKQFKAFLLLFEQLLADFHAQIRHAINLLSPIPIQRSYAHVLPEDVPRFAELIRNAAQIATYYEDPEKFRRRRNQLLDHLLARFAEQYREYSMLVESAYDAAALPLLIADKERLLNNFAQLSFSRFQAYDYMLRDAARTISGLERRLRILLGYTSDVDSNLFPEEEIFILEHMLLRPYFFDEDTDREEYVADNDGAYLLPTCFDEDDSDCCAGDAYSFRITVIMPAWPQRFQDMNFRNYLARFIREQTPAHIFVKVCWISLEQMIEFRSVYETWKDALAIRGELPAPSVYLTALERLIDVWSKLRSVYPPVHLYDCTDVKDITPTVLGDSTLGQMNGGDDDQD